MQYSFKKIPITFNNQTLIVDDVQLSQEITLEQKDTLDSRITESQYPASMWAGKLNIKYYLYSGDFLKQYIYSNEGEPISGNIGGLMFNQGYLSNYSLNILPNSPISVNATISFYDQLTGNFNPSQAIINTGLIFRTADVHINNLPNYSVNILNNFFKATFDYSCSLKPSVNYFDTGVIPYKADDVFIEDKIITTEIVSDNTIFNLPLSGEKFGAFFTFSNPNNTGLYESFGCSGLIRTKSFSVNADSPHTHSIKIIQHHVNKQGYICSVTTGINQIIINSNSGSFPFLSRDGSLPYIDKVSIGDTPLTGYTINRTSSYDQIVSPIPFNIIDDTLTVYTSYGNYIWPHKINFSYPQISITGISALNGKPGDNITISGTNFIRISDILFGGNVEAPFQIINPQTITTVVPNNGYTYPITIMSRFRNTTGVSSLFFYNPSITGIIPTTGQWKDSINILGYNFSGITGLYFNNVPAYSFTVNNNSQITAQSPDTGLPFAQGYITLYGSGGFGQSISTYNPVVPIYGFSPSTGFPNTGMAIYTKIDTGYLCPSSGVFFYAFDAFNNQLTQTRFGYKVRVGGEDTIFFISGANPTGQLTGIGNCSTGTLTGYLPSPIYPYQLYSSDGSTLISYSGNSSTDYIYIYGPDGISNYVSSQKLNIIGSPVIYYISPIAVNQYKDFDLLVVGQNLNSFSNLLPYSLSFSGGVSGNAQFYNSNIFNNALNGNTLLITGLIITGNTGVYNVFIQNVFNGYTLSNGLQVNPAVNLSKYCTAAYQSRGGLFNDGVLRRISALNCIDGSPNTFADLGCYRASYSPKSSGTLSITPINQYLTVSYLIINPSYTGAPSLRPSSNTFPDAGLSANNYTPFSPPSGIVSIYQNTTIPYMSSILNFSGKQIAFTPPLTGVTKINIYSITGTAQKYLALYEVQIY